MGMKFNGGFLMTRLYVLVLSGLVFAGGCSSEKSIEPAADTPISANSEASKVTTALAELSPEEREAAIAQKICPVSDQELGSMGKPIKVTVEGQEVFVCCAGCIDELKNNFAEYKAKLDK
jgi:hypothetical protein